MKKAIAIMAVTLSSTVFAGSVSIEGQGLQGSNGSPDQQNVNMTARGNVSESFVVHGQVSSTQTTNPTTNTVATRLETGLTGSTALFGPFKGHTTVAIGELYRATGNSSYYSVEPAVTAPIGTSGFTGRLAYRYRTAISNPNVNKDTTQTVRVGLFYAVTKQDTVGVRYDKVSGDATQNGYALNYTRSF